MSNMTHLPKDTKPMSIWQRLLTIFNLGGPQWGRPQDDQQNDGEDKDNGSSSQNGDNNNDQNDQDEDRQRPNHEPGRGSQSGESPPDLDQIWRDLSGKLGGLLGGGGGGDKGGGSGRRPNNRPNRPSRPPISGKGASFGLGLIIAFAVLAWGASGLFTVQEGEESVILTFGKFKTTVGPGLSWHLPYPIETHETVATAQVRSVEIGNSTVNSITGLNNASMLTQDKNILDVRFTVQYRINNLKAYLFNNTSTKDAVMLAAESAVREVLGKTPMEVAINLASCVEEGSEIIQAGAAVEAPIVQAPQAIDAFEGVVKSDLAKEIINDIQSEGQAGATQSAMMLMGRSECPAGTIRQPLYAPIMKTIQLQLDNLGLGIEITAVNISDSGVQVPDKVKPAFDAARSATAEKESLINEGKLYANSRIASATGVVSRLEQDAEAYRASAVAQAKGDTERFSQIYAQYRLAPEVTRNRMYLETMQEIYSNVSKVMMESKSNSLLYVPLDRLLSQGQSIGQGAVSGSGVSNAPSQTQPNASIGAPTGSNTQTLPATVSTETQSDRARGNLSRARY